MICPPLSSSPFIILKAAISLNGCLDEGTGKRTVLSDDDDLQAVDALRAECNAILIGGGTARYDNPSLLIKSPAHIGERKRKRLSDHPLRIILWGKTPLSSYLALHVFTQKEAETIALLHHSLKEEANSLPPHVKKIFFTTEHITPDEVIDFIRPFNIKRLIIEGGARLSADFIETENFHQLRLAYSPVVINSKSPVRLLPTEDKTLNNFSSILSGEGKMTLLEFFPYINPIS